MATQTLTAPPLRRSSIFGSVWRVLKPILRKPAGFIGFTGVMFFLIVAFLGPLVVPIPRTDVDHIREAPSAAHPLGTDNQGKDILILLIRGGTDVMVIAFTAGILTTLIAVTLGSLAAYLGGYIDQGINFVGNYLLTLPSFILLSVLSTILRLDNPLLLALLLSILFWPSLMRSIRSQVLSLRERDYIEAAVALDLGTRHIIINEILPNMASYIIINMIFVITSAIYTMIGLIFLGFVSISVTTPNWGIIINAANGAGAISNPDNALWLLAPVIAISLLQWFLVTLARSIEDAFNPRLKSGG